MTNPLFAWPGLLVCVLIVVGAICRITLLRPGTHRALYPAMYGLWAVFALGVGIDLFISQQLRWYVAFGPAGIALHLVESWRRWQHSAPLETQKEPGHEF